MNPKNFFAELKRRRVYSVAVAYVVGGWALAQGIAQVFPVFDIPIWVVRLIVVLIVLGFPVALTLSWFFDFTRYGIVRTPDRAPEDRVEVVGSNVSSEKSIAVLPFTDLSPGKDHAYFSDGSCRGDTDSTGKSRWSASSGTALFVLVQGKGGRIAGDCAKAQRASRARGKRAA